MPLDRDELLNYYRESRASLLEAINELTDAQMTETSLDGWSICDHLAHLALWDEARAQEVERISAGHRSVFQMSHDQDTQYNEMGYALRRDLTPAQARWELETSRRRLLDAIGAASPAGLEPANYGEAGLKTGHEIQHADWIRNWREGRGI